MNIAENFSETPKTKSWVKHIHWSCEALPLPSEGGTLIPFGLGNSLGDVCLNDGGTVPTELAWTKSKISAPVRRWLTRRLPDMFTCQPPAMAKEAL